MAFHFRQNSMFHFTLYFTQSILHFVFAIWVCARDSTFLHSTFNFDSCNIQVFAFDFQLFISTSQVFEFDLQVQWNVHSFFLHPTFSICPLSFRFRHPTLGIVLASFRIRHSSFGIGLLPAGQRPIEIVGSTDLTHPRSNGGRESIERLSSGVNTGDPLHSRQTRRRQTCSRPCDKDGHHRQDFAAQSASLSAVRATLLRVADRLSSMEETPSPSKYRATFVKYEEVMCPRRHKLLACSASLFWSLHARCVLDGIDHRMKYFRKLLFAILLFLCILLVSLFFDKEWVLICCPPAIKNRSA